jgi:3-dehydroquinate synthase
MYGTSDPIRIAISSAAGTYSVVIGAGVLTEPLAVDGTVVIADRYFAPYLTHHGVTEPIYLVADERSKTLSTVDSVLEEMRSRGLRRDGHVLAVGGGIVQDVVTMAAQLYMRGVSWSLAPTTLMSMADSCIGGKSSINVGSVKNLAGGFYPPSEIFIDPSFVETLPQVDQVCGLLEAVKIAFCRSEATFDEYLGMQNASDFTNLATTLKLVLEAKKWFIEIDEFDQAERRVLNFGHTFGHALEAGTSFRVPHGVAVGIGILAAIAFVEISRELSDSEERLRSYVSSVVSSVTDMPEIAQTCDWELFRGAFESDKKHRADQYLLVLPAGGDPRIEVRAVVRSEDSRQRVVDAMRAALEMRY